MRALNMNDLPWLRHTTLKGMQCIGRGEFANVYGAKTGDFDTVTKVTADRLSYCLQADGLFQQVRSRVEKHFPRLVTNTGDVGESRGSTVFVVELERLVPVNTTAHRRLIRYWAKAYEEHRRSVGNSWPVARRTMMEASLSFCEAQAGRSEQIFLQGDAEQYAPVWEALAYFLSNYGGCLDLKLSNFMVRPSTGDLVFNDVIYDAEGAERRYRARHKAH